MAVMNGFVNSASTLRWTLRAEASAQPPRMDRPELVRLCPPGPIIPCTMSGMDVDSSMFALEMSAICFSMGILLGTSKNWTGGRV